MVRRPGFDKNLTVKTFFKSAFLAAHGRFLSSTVGVAALLVVWIGLFFYDVVFWNRTLLTTHIVPAGTLPGGAYGYTGHRPPLSYVMDAAASAWNHEPTTQLTSRLYKKGIVPLWNPHSGLGMPLNADMISTVFFPLSFLLYLNPSPAMWDFFFLLRIFLAGMFTYGFLRGAMKLELPGACLGAIAYMFCGHLMLHINIVFINAALLLPALLYAMDALFQNPSRLRIVWAGLTVGLVLLSGHPEPAFFALFYGISYYLARFLSSVVPYKGVRRCAPPATNAQQFQQLSSLIGSLILGLSLSAILILPFLEFVENSPIFRHDPQFHIGQAHLPVGKIFMLGVPYVWGPITLDWDFQPGYAGFIVTLLVLAALMEKTAFEGRYLFFTLMVAFFILKGYGISDFFNRWVGNLPVFNVSIFPKYFAPEFLFSMAVLAGGQVDKIWQGKSSLRGLLGAMVLGFITLAFLSGSVDLKGLQNFGGVHLLLNPVASIFYPLLLCLLLTLGIWLKNRQILSNPRLVGLIGAALTLELWLLLPKDHPHRYPPFVEPPYIQFLKKDPGVFRVYGLDGFLYPNVASAYGLDDVGFVNGLAIQRFWKFASTMISPQLTLLNWNLTAGGPLGDIRNLDNPFFNLFNLKYVVTRPDGAPPAPSFDRVYKGEAKIYRNRNALPRAFIVHRAELLSGEEKIFTRLKAEDFNLQRQILLEEVEDPGMLDGYGAPEVDGSRVEILSHEATRVHLRAQMENPGFLVLGDPYYPGWKAYVNGDSRKIYLTDYFIRSVFLERGVHEVEFRYEPASYKIGAWSLLMGLAGITALMSFNLGRLARTL